MKKECEETLYNNYAESTLRFMVEDMVFGTRFYQEGVHYYGKSHFFSEAYFQELLSLIHPRHLTQNVHFVFFPNRRSVLSKLFSADYCCRQDIVSLFKKNPFSCFQSETDTYIYFYDFNFDKKWEETMIVVTILTYLYELRHANMPEEKRKKKREKYLLRMLDRLKSHFEAKKENQLT